VKLTPTNVDQLTNRLGIYGSCGTNRREESRYADHSCGGAK